MSDTSSNGERQLALYAMLSRIGRSIVRADNPHDLYLSVCRIAVEDGRFAGAWVAIADPGSAGIVPIARAGAPVDLERVPETLSATEPGPSAHAIRAGRPFVANDAPSDGRLASWRDVLREADVKSLAAFPLAQEGRSVGALVLAAHEGHAFDAPRVVRLEELAADVSFALEAMRREEKRAAAESKIQYLAFYDAQTGLPGREQWTRRLADVCEAAAGHPSAVLAVRLRSYHGVLQVLGQAHAASVARCVAERLEKLLPTSVVGRISEAEFAVIAEGDEGLHVFEEAAWRICSALAEGVQVGGREVFLDPFVGIAVHPKDGSPSDVLEAALVAAGSGPQDATERCRFYSVELDRRSQRRLELVAALRHALARREFVLHYQPQVDLASGRIVGTEALLRWQPPGQPLVSPADFIPLLEETGLIVGVGAWVIEEACRCAQRLQEAGLPPLRMAVNLSARQFQDDDVSARVKRTLHETGLEARWLELEITEGVVLLNTEAVIRALADLRARGVSHSLDDFGTGYSSLTYLQRLPVERIKIDRSFITNITSDPQDAAIVRAVVGMAHSLGLGVIAEGVETEGQVGYLRGLGCEEVQGYYFSRPLPEDGFAALLRDKPQFAWDGEPASGRRVLLLVDDEPNVLTSLRRLLRRSEIEVLATSRVDEAFNLLATRQVGVIVCDQRMPEMTGTEFLRRVKELYPKAVRVILSGYTELNSVIDAVNRGAIYKFLTKPWEDKALVESLRDAFRMYEIERENRELSERIRRLLAAERRPAGLEQRSTRG